MNNSKHSISPTAAPDPLVIAIRLYQRGLAEFNFRSFDVEDDAWNSLVPETYGPHLDTLINWDHPATTAEGAMLALRISLTDDNGVYGSDAADAMIRAAYGYLRGIAE